MTQPLSPYAPEPSADRDIDVSSSEPRPEDVIAFPDGLPGFESCRRFVVVTYDDDQLFQCLQGLDAPGPAFLTIDPARALKRYRLILSPADRLRLDVRKDDTLLWLAIVMVAPDGTKTVNLRAPVVVNPRIMVGFQVMPHHSLYPIRQPLDL
jgi:flagellar assembly factor FliW